jgi:hypothetical protein
MSHMFNASWTPLLWLMSLGEPYKMRPRGPSVGCCEAYSKVPQHMHSYGGHWPTCKTKW